MHKVREPEFWIEPIQMHYWKTTFMSHANNEDPIHSETVQKVTLKSIFYQPLPQ